MNEEDSIETDKTADEMFKKLGYTEINSKPTYIEYLNKQDWGAYERIKFEYRNKRVVRDARTGSYNKMIRYITLDELKAINKKCEELGWI